jgi:putative ATP-dependent endonuclease of OLD family
MEEPEAHLHPQAQRQLYAQIHNFNGQKIISSHSPSVLAQAALGDIIHFDKTGGKTHASRFDVAQHSKEDLNRISREVINTRGELLFSKAVILCEGITEEQALPVYFKEFFGKDAIFCGVNIIGIGGQNYSTFLKLIKDFEIHWFIFSDGEEKAIKAVKNAIKIITDKDLEFLSNVVVLDNSEDYERHLISCGYGEILVEAINKCEDDTNFFDRFVKTRNHTHSKPQMTEKICSQCGQNIYEGELRNYDGNDGRKRAVVDCCKKEKAKAKYASFVAEQIVAQEDSTKRIPTKVKILFDEIDKALSIRPKEVTTDD